MPDDRRLLLKPKEAANALGVSERTIYNWIASGVIKSVKIGGLRRIPVSEVERLAKPAQE